MFASAATTRMTKKTETESPGYSKQMRVLVTIGALLLALAHMIWPGISIDGITLTLIVIALIPWLQPIFKTLEFPGGWKVAFQDLQRTTQDQVRVTLQQTIATVISWVQAEEIRASRHLLFEAEDSQRISRLPVEQWKQDWRQAADRVAQAFNSAGIVVQQDERLQKAWVRPTRRAILKSWWIAQPCIRERRKEQNDLWQEFDWLAEKARRFSSPDELKDWGLEMQRSDLLMKS